MAQTGYTPILIYASGTPTNVPLAANLTSSASGAELALNYADGKLYFKNSSGVVTLLAGSGGGGPAAGSNTQVQFNNNGVFGASANMTFNGTRLTVADLADSGLTSGRVTYASTGGALVDSANLTFDGTNLTLGGGTANGVAYLNGSKVLTTGSALTFDGTNLGVGTFSPASIVHVVEGSTTAAMRIQGRSSDGLGRLDFFLGDGTTFAGRLQLVENTSDIRLRAQSNLQFFNGTTEGMRLTSTGLGIGTSSPTTKLDINQAAVGTAGLRIFGTSSPGLNISETSGSVTSQFVNDAAGSYLGTVTVHPLVLRTSGTERARITSGGAFGIGTNNPQTALDVHSPTTTASGSSSWDTNGATLNLFYNGAGATDAGSSINFTTLAVIKGAQEASGGGNGYLSFLTRNGNAGEYATERARITASGQLLIGGTSSQGNNSRLQVVGGMQLFGSQGANAAVSTISSFNTNSSGFEIAKIDFFTGANIYEGQILFSTKDAGGTMAERARITSGGDLLVGTTSSDGSTSNGARVVGGLFRTAAGSVATTNGVAATVLTLPTGIGTYIVSAYINADDAINYSSVSLLTAQAGGATVVNTVLRAGNLLTITMSGYNIQVTQVSGGGATVVCSIVKLA